MESFSTELIVLFVLIVANGLFSMAEIAIVSSRKARLQQRAEEGDERARIALELATHPATFLSTVQIGITLVGILAGAYGGATIADRLAPELNRISWIAPHGAAVSLSTVVLGITFLTLLLGELVPKQIALQHAERLAAAFAPGMRSLAWLAAPLVRLLAFASTLVLRLFAIKPSTEASITEEEVKLMIEQGTQEGVFEPTEQEMVERVFRLGDRTVSAIMTPRPDVIWLDVNDPPEEIQRKITSSSHTHYPVAEDEIDHVIGMVNTKDLLSQHLGCRPTDLRAILRPALYIPETMSALAVLERFKKKRTHVAVVIDEHGGFQGLVTTSDVLEAIVGDIPTPEEDDAEEILRREDGSYLMDGKVPADELKEVLDLEELPFEDENLYQTLGGMVMAYLDRIPRAGDSFAWKGFCFEVVDMDGHRVDKVLVRREPEGPQAADRP